MKIRTFPRVAEITLSADNRETLKGIARTAILSASDKAGFPRPEPVGRASVVTISQLCSHLERVRRTVWHQELTADARNEIDMAEQLLLQL